MKKYNVFIKQDEEFLVQVEADNEEEANTKAMEAFSEGDYQETPAGIELSIAGIVEVEYTDEARSEDEEFKMKVCNTQEEARQYAIEYQNWSSNKSLSYGELFDYGSMFKRLAEKFDLEEEFKENGII